MLETSHGVVTPDLIPTLILGPPLLELMIHVTRAVSCSRLPVKDNLASCITAAGQGGPTAAFSATSPALTHAA